MENERKFCKLRVCWCCPPPRFLDLSAGSASCHPIRLGNSEETETLSDLAASAFSYTRTRFRVTAFAEFSRTGHSSICCTRCTHLTRHLLQVSWDYQVGFKKNQARTRFRVTAFAEFSWTGYSSICCTRCTHLTRHLLRFLGTTRLALEKKNL